MVRAGITTFHSPNRYAGRLAVVEELLDRGATVDITTRRDYTPLPDGKQL